MTREADQKDIAASAGVIGIEVVAVEKAEVILQQYHHADNTKVKRKRSKGHIPGQDQLV